MKTRKAGGIPPAERPLNVPVQIDLDLLDELANSSIPGRTRNEKIVNAIRRGLELEEEAKGAK